MAICICMTICISTTTCMRYFPHPPYFFEGWTGLPTMYTTRRAMCDDPSELRCELVSGRNILSREVGERMTTMLRICVYACMCVLREDWRRSKENGSIIAD